jgi:hypothetical protein
VVVPDPFIEAVADRLAALAGVRAIQLGGSRAAGTPTERSDWDLAIYYRGSFDADQVRALGWPGTVWETGGWAAPMMNGGAWVEVDGQRVDLHLRDLETIDSLRVEAAVGRFAVYRSQYFIAGIPSYVPLAEIGTGSLLSGELPTVDFPDALRRSASEWWRREAEQQLGYVASLKNRSLAVIAGGVSKAIIEASHARLCEAGRWVTGEKRIVDAAGLGSVEAQLIERLAAGEPPDRLVSWVAGELGLEPR